MKKAWVVLFGSLMLAAGGLAHAQKPAAKPAAKGPDALQKAMDRAVANYNKNMHKGSGMAMEAKPAQKAEKKK